MPSVCLPNTTMGLLKTAEAGTWGTLRSSRATNESVLNQDEGREGAARIRFSAEGGVFVLPIASLAGTIRLDTHAHGALD